MTARVVKCPSCQREARLAGPAADGKRLRCPQCQTVFTLGGPPAGAAPGGRASRQEATEATERPKRRPRRADRDDDEGEGRRPRRRKQQRGGPSGLLIGLVGGGVLLVVGGVVTALLLWRGGGESAPGGGGLAGGGPVGGEPGIILVGSEDQDLPKDPKWRRGPEVRKLLPGRWRAADTRAYEFRPDGTYEHTGLMSAAGSYRFVADDRIDVTFRLKFPPDSPPSPAHYLVRVNEDELVLLRRFSEAEPDHYTVDGTYFRVRDAGGGGNTKALDPWLAKLQAPDLAQRRQAAVMLDQMGKDAWPAVPALTAALDDPDQTVRGGAASCLGKIGPKAKEAVPALRQLLRSPEDGMKRVAMIALGGIGPEARDAIPDLAAYADNIGLGPEARASLRRIDPQGKW